jgi:hypothetical protein
MKTLVRVLAQFTDENGKPKGGQEFTFRADGDDLMYAQEGVLEKTIQKLLDIEDEKWGGYHTYVSHELVFHEPIELQGDFEAAMSEVYKMEVTNG